MRGKYPDHLLSPPVAMPPSPVLFRCRHIYAPSAPSSATWPARFYLYANPIAGLKTPKAIVNVVRTLDRDQSNRVIARPNKKV
jgi:hypothetical protein